MLERIEAAIKTQRQGSIETIERRSINWYLERWNHIDKEYCFKLGKPILEKIEAAIKIPKGAIKY